MDRFLKIVEIILDAVGTLANIIVILGGCVIGGAFTWVVLSASEVTTVLALAGTFAGGLAGGFLAWLLMRILILFDP